MSRKTSKSKALLGPEPSDGGVPVPTLSTGSTLLNLACGGSPDAGWAVGKYYLIVGDPTAGKTFLAMSVMAEACMNKAFDKYTLVYDNVEDGCDMDLDRLFGERLRKRLRAPHKTGSSQTIEEFYFALDSVMNDGPVIYILDSMDSLTSQKEEEHFQDEKKATAAGKDVAGTFGVSKAKRNSDFLRRCMSRLRDTGSILIILSQTRDNLGFGFEKKTRSGGNALRFYATLELWASVRGKLKKKYKGKDRTIGITSRWTLKKNRISGRLGQVDFNIYPSFGIDDTGSCVDYLVDEGFWEVAGRTIMARGLHMELSRDKLIERIEEEGMEPDLRNLVGKCWDDIQQGTAIQRKSRYA